MFGKDGLSEYMCMYMPTVVSSGSSVKILYPREFFDSWADLEGPLRTVSLTLFFDRRDLVCLWKNFELQ
jgi:hypothetical protein